MEKWEYKIVTQLPLDEYELQRGLNSYGKEGWELVIFDSERAIFKRQINQQA